MPSSAIKAIFTKTFVAISLINMLGLAGYYAIFVVSTQFLSEVFHINPRGNSRLNDMDHP